MGVDMLIIQNKDGSYVPGMGGDPRLFTQLEALIYIRDRVANDPSWADSGAVVKPYIPNPMHLDAIEYLQDKGFSIYLDTDRNRIFVDCDTMWTAPMTDLLHDTLQNGEHYANRDHDFKIKFGKSNIVNIAFQDHSLAFPVYFEYKGEQFTPTDWARRVEQ